MNRADLGHMGEAVAAKYYIRQGYLLLNHNYRTRMGELDLILYRADTIVFAEVKTRPSAQRAAAAGTRRDTMPTSTTASRPQAASTDHWPRGPASTALTAAPAMKATMT